MAGSCRDGLFSTPLRSGGCLSALQATSSSIGTAWQVRPLPWCQRWLRSNTPARGSAVNKSLPHDFVAFMAEEAEHLLSRRETILCSSEHAFSDNIRFLRKCHGSSLASFAREVGHHVK